MSIPSAPAALRLLRFLGTLALIYFTFTRVALVALYAGEAGLSPLELIGVFACGALYDAAFIVYLLSPVALLVLLPARWWQTRAWRALLWLGMAAWLFVLGFIAESEIIFFDEFGARFNFIAVDYLVYTSEVLNNIWQSYAVVWLLVANAAVSLIVLWLLQPRLARIVRAPARGGPSIALALGLLAALTAATLGQGPRAAFANAYAEELASNGPYQLFAAFRNNELDYARFYPTLPPKRVDALLRDELAEPNARFLSDVPFELHRRIDNVRPPRRLNVVLVMVESLGADLVGHYGGTRGFTPYLDELAADSLVFEQAYATGTRTVRGLEAVTLSLPPTPGRAIVKRLGRESGLWSLGRVLDAHGYESYFVYGGRAYFDNMGAFFAGNGYRVVDQTSTPSADIAFANAWGMSDEDLYRQALDVAARYVTAGAAGDNQYNGYIVNGGLLWQF